MATLYDIAKIAGVAPSTVSKVLNNYKGVSKKTREIVTEAIKEMNYVPNLSAQMLTTKKSYIIGVISKEPNYNKSFLVNSHYAAVLESARVVLEAEGYELLFLNNRIGNENVSYSKHYQYRGLDGVIITRGISDDDTGRQLKIFTKENVPKVSVEGLFENTCSVISKNVEGAIRGLNYLYFLGHRKIGLIKAKGNRIASVQREEGYLQFLKQNNIEFNPDYVVEIPKFSYESGMEASRILTRKGYGTLPTAIFCIYDEIAFGLIDGLKQYGISVPKDISVVGFDDKKLAEYYKLTTVGQNRHAIGVTTANDLLRQMSGEGVGKKKCITIETELIIRESCMKIEEK